MIVEYGDMTGRYFTFWRIKALHDLLDLFRTFGVVLQDIKIWYDDREDFHCMSCTVGNNSALIRFYKVYSATVNGEDYWVGCPRYAAYELVKSLGRRLEGKCASAPCNNPQQGYRSSRANRLYCRSCAAQINAREPGLIIPIDN